MPNFKNIIYHKKLSAIGLKTYLIIADHDFMDLTRSDLTRLTGFCLPTVVKAVLELKNLKILKVTESHQMQVSTSGRNVVMSVYSFKRYTE